MNVSVGNKRYSLGKDTYLAGGGEGSVYIKDGFAFKIYHDKAKALPEGKIRELSVLAKLGNVLVPQDVIYSNNDNVGFIMKYVNNTEFLCKLFTKSFRDKNSITPAIINGLVKNMQDTLNKIHSEGILVVDYNELNFLVNQAFDTVYHIDTDSYQTKTYPATALMESVRDRQVKNKQFTQNSDWFSFACVVFQLYIGCHPYKGRHPNFAAKDWMDMMDQNISVFSKDVKLPPACQPLSVIPPGHLKWFEKVFKGDRLPPPQPDQVIQTVIKAQPQIISGNNQFDVSIFASFKKIVAARYIDGIIYVLTDDGLYANDRWQYNFTPAAKMEYDIVGVQGDKPCIIEYSKVYRTLRLISSHGEVAKYEMEGFFVNKKLYCLMKGSLTEIMLINFGAKIVCSQQVISPVFSARTVFDGFVWQDILGTCRLSIPALGAGSIHIKELDKARFVAGKFLQNFLVAFVEKNGKYIRYILKFDKQNYVLFSESLPLEDINFTVKDNGVAILATQDKLVAFASLDKMKEFDSPLNDEALISMGNEILAVGDRDVHKIRSK